jgi:heptosyltransferase-3
LRGNRCVIVHQGALGDFLLALPVIEGLVEASCGLELDFWSRPDHLSLLYGKPYVGSTFDAGGTEWMPFHQNGRWQACSLPPGVEEACCILVFGQASSAVAAQRLQKRVQSPVYWFKSFPDENGKHHATDLIEDQLRACGLPLMMTPLRLIPDPRELSDVRERTGRSGVSEARPLVVVHPGSGGFRKIWPHSRWRLLLQWLCERGDLQILIVVGPADEKIRPFAREVGTAGGVSVVDTLELPALAALLSDADLYIGSDSGVTHLAASMGTPAVAIFGPTDPAVWGPRGGNVEIFQDSWDSDEILQPWASDSGCRSASQLVAAVEARLAAGIRMR